MRSLESALSAAARRRDSIGAATAVASLWGATLALPQAAAAILAGVSSLAAAGLLWRLGSLEATARRLASQSGGNNLDKAVDFVGERPAAAAEREAQVHPVSGAPQQEPLADRIAADIASSPAERSLGVIRFADYDRLAAFDLEGANTALIYFATRLMQATNRDIAVGQIDRDTFALWFPVDAGGRSAAAQFQALVYVARQDLDGAGGLMSPTVEAAMARFPADGRDAAHLFARAKAALSGQPSGPAASPIATPAPVDAVRTQFRLEQDLGHAIEDGQLKMVFQPVVDAVNNRLLGAEALLRWDHPTLGPVSPAHFIPMVEAADLADQFGLFVLNTACREARRWQDEGHTGLRVAVNLSARQLNDPELEKKIARTLARHHLAPTTLELELTETAAMSGADRTFALFEALRRTGISLAIDDFGSGYSSLSYLKNLPFDKLKIDREFVTDLDSRRDSRAICRALIELGRGLELAVLAEGVETAAEVETLRELGCRIFQGYYFSKPLSGEDFRRLVADPTWPAPPREAASRVHIDHA